MSYDTFARYYDELTANIDYPALAKYFDDLISRFGGKKGILLDLACGTGTLSVLMSKRGYDVIGTDASPEMLDAAMSKPHDGVQYLCQDMTALDMFGTIDAAVCALDSINHLESLDDVQAVFDRVALFMNAGGVFVFDVNTPYKHSKVLADNTYVYETDDVFCVWENEYEGGGVTAIQLDFFERDGDVYRRSSDFFTETAWQRRTIEKLLKKAGFELCACYEYPTENAPTEKCEKLTFVARIVNAKNREA
ncbi:MAG: methyltransferase domain-containing protein [Ruminiclostridium sp.]|nr:methyltransferase domain-containing protein [Ruminiclostridium sp.]